MEWKLSNFPGNEAGQLKFEFRTGTSVDSTRDILSWKRPHIRIAFTIRNYTASGIQVCDLRIVEKSAYEVDKRLKAMTSSNAFYVKW